MSRNAIVAGCMAISMVAIGIASGTATPVLYGISESTTSTNAVGIVSSLTALLSGIGGFVALFKTGIGINSITDAVELLRPVLTGKSSLPEGAVRVALTVLEADAVRRNSKKDYDDVKALAKQFLFPTLEPPK